MDGACAQSFIFDIPVACVGKAPQQVKIESPTAEMPPPYKQMQSHYMISASVTLTKRKTKFKHQLTI